MAKYTKEFKQQTLELIQQRGHIEVIREYKEKYGIRPETIRLWMNPVKQKILCEKVKQHYYKNMQNVEFKLKRQRLSKLNYKQKFNLDIHYSDKSLISEFNNVQNKKGRYDAVPSMNRNILQYQPHFYNFEKQLFKDPVIRNKLEQNRLKYINKTLSEMTTREILSSFKISGIYANGYSFFSPLWIKAFIEEFNIKSIYDPCGGWGHRMLGANNIRYIYNDFWTESVNGVQKIKEKYKLTNHIIYNFDCTQFTPLEEYEAIFTCPPYFNVEKYNNKQYKDINDYKIWIQKMMSCALKPCVKYIGIVISERYAEIIKNCITLPIIREQAIGNIKIQSHFNRTNNTPRGDVLLIFQARE